MLSNLACFCFLAVRIKLKTARARKTCIKRSITLQSTKYFADYNILIILSCLQVQRASKVFLSAND